MRAEARSFERACYCAAAWGFGLVPAPVSPLLPRTWRLISKGNSRYWWAAWVATFPPYQGKGSTKQSRDNEIVLPFPQNALTDSRSTSSWAKAHTAGVPPWDSGSELKSSRQDLPCHPARPPQPSRLEPRGGPIGTHLLIRLACSCWRSRGGAVGGRCPSPGRQRPLRRRAPPLSSRPPACEAPGAGQVGVGCGLRCFPGAQNSFHSGNLSILKFLPVSCKTAAAGNVAWYGHRHGQTNRETDRQIEGEGRTGKRGVLNDRDEDTKMVFLRSKKGKIPLFPHSCLSVFNFSLYISHESVGRSLQTAALLRKKGKHTTAVSDRWARRCPNPSSEWEN